jgi:single-stranded-DNA-specific exonuclease
MRLVITDHHLPLGGGRLPAADAIVNPKVTGAPHPFDGLSGAGVAWKLLCELERRGVVLSGSGAQAVGLAAIGTVCDVMPLVGENRSIVERGLEQLSECPPIGLGSLIERLGLRRSLLASDLGFLVGPHLNAAGRMGDARVALDLCLASSPATAEALADELVVLNAERKRAVEEACVEAEDQVATLDEDAACVVVGSRRWSAGIVGLVAARLVERYGRPAVAVAVAEPWGRGSARSTADVNVTEALCEVPAGVLGRFGGHRAAAGLSVREGDIPRLREALDRAVRIQGFAVGPEHEVDAVVPLSAVTASLLAEVSRLEPCGAGNPAVLLAALGCRVVAARGLGAGGRHLSIELDAGGAGARVRGVAWNRPLLVSQVAQHLPPGRRVDILFTVGSAWNGRGVEVQLRDIRAEAARPWDRREALPTEEAGEAELPLGEVPQGVR